MKTCKHIRHSDLTAQTSASCVSLKCDKHDDCFNLFLSVVGTSLVLLLYFKAVSWLFSNKKNATHHILAAEIKIIFGDLKGNSAKRKMQLLLRYYIVS